MTPPLLLAAWIAALPLPEAPAAAGPSFACGAAAAGSVEALICRDRELSRLDRQLAATVAAARARAAAERPPQLPASQRAWLRRRDACRQAADQRSCLRSSYRLRTAELQALYRLVPIAGQGRFQCGASPADELVATFFPTDPATLVAERGDRTALLVVQPSGSGARYAGAGVQFWEHQGEVRLRWGSGAAELRCRRVR